MAWIRSAWVRRRGSSIPDTRGPRQAQTDPNVKRSRVGQARRNPRPPGPTMRSRVGQDVGHEPGSLPRRRRRWRHTLRRHPHRKAAWGAGDAGCSPGTGTQELKNPAHCCVRSTARSNEPVADLASGACDDPIGAAVGDLGRRTWLGGADAEKPGAELGSVSGGAVLVRNLSGAFDGAEKCSRKGTARATRGFEWARSCGREGWVACSEGARTTIL